MVIDVQPKPPSGEVYLGDGLYASFDGWHIWLRAPHAGGNHVVALDPTVYRALTEFAKQIWPQT